MVARLGRYRKHQFAVTQRGRGDFGSARNPFFALIEVAGGLGGSEGGPLACEWDPSRPPVSIWKAFPIPGGKHNRPKDARPELMRRMTSPHTQSARPHCHSAIPACESSAKSCRVEGAHSPKSVDSASTPTVNFFSGKDCPMQLRKTTKSANNAILFSQTTGWPPLKTASWSKIKSAKKSHAPYAALEKMKFHSGRKKWCAK